MVKKGKNTKMIGILLMLLAFISVPHYYSSRLATKTNSRQYNEQNVSTTSEDKDFMYLSDIPYVKNMSKSGWNDFYFDKAGDGTKITIHYENGEWAFDKGVWAHAKSWIVYDLQDYSAFDYFTAFVGLNKTAYNNSNGVQFTIFVSNDGTDWEQKWQSSVKKGPDNADLVKIGIKGYRYLKLYADDCNGNGSDHSVYADAKLIKEGYKEYDYTIKTVEEYDQEIAAITDKSFTNPTYEKLVLQRYLVREFGEYGLKRFLSENEQHITTWEWLTEDLDNLRMYVMGGRPDGSYYNSFTVLNQLLNATLKDGTKLINDFDNQKSTKYETTTMGNLYKRMAITLSLTHSTLVGLWMNPNVVENQSDAVTRYEIYKWLYNNDKFKVSNTLDQTKWFEDLEIEEMRFVMNNIIDDEEIIWLNEYTQKIIDAHPTETEKYLTPHPYMKYIDPNYSKPEYYDPNMLSKWDNQYGNFNSKYGVTYKVGVQKLWMNLDNGAVCGGISKIGSNIRGVHGTPSSVINQPGHAALIYWRENANGEGYWTIDNDVSDWKQSNKTEKLTVRMPLGWGDESYLSKTDVSEGVVNYVLLAQAALNDYANYEKSRELYISADLETEPQRKIDTYKKSLEALPINVDAWYGIIENYRVLEKSDADYFTLAKYIMQELKYYPLPMYHLLEEILDDVVDVNMDYQIVQLRTETLESVSTLDNSLHIQAYAIRVEANYLLNKIDSSLASFSFDGDNAKQIVLAENYQNARWNYCLEGDACKPKDPNSVFGNEYWTEVTNSSKALLSDSDISKVNATNDIYVHLVGVNYTDTNLYKIDIQKPDAPTLYANDLENRVVGVDENMEWRIIKDENQEYPNASWVSFKETSPVLTGNKMVEVRATATGIKLTSDSVTYEFTQDKEDLEHQYIPVSKYSIYKVSTEATGQKRFATNSIDGNLNTSWHSDWSGNDRVKEIIIKLNHSYYLTGLDYVPIPQANNGGNGLIWRAKIEVSQDGENWQTITPTVNEYVQEWDTEEPLVVWENQNLYKTSQVWRHVDFNASLGRYVKITGVKTNPLNNGLSFMTASMFNLYQDATKYVEPSLEISYNTIAPTNENVVARVVNLEEDVEVTAICNSDNEESCFLKRSDFEDETTEEAKKELDEMMQTHVFSENGTVYFQYHNKVESPETYYYEEATVANIDRDLPKVTVEYTKDSATNQDVTAILKANEPIKVHTGVPVNYDEDGNMVPVAPEEDGTYHEMHKTLTHIFTFEDNGTFTFEYEDLAGNVGSTVAEVSWIDREAPYASIHYSVNETTSDKVLATLVPEKEEKIIILNNNGDATYTFDKNGSFEFVFQDEAGNISEATANVDWIVAKPQEEEQTPNDKEEQNTTSQEQTSDANTNGGNSNTQNSSKNKSTNKKNQVNNNVSTSQTVEQTEENIPNTQVEQQEQPIEQEEKKQIEEEQQETTDKNKKFILPFIGVGIVGVGTALIFTIRKKN